MHTFNETHSQFAYDDFTVWVAPIRRQNKYTGGRIDIILECGEHRVHTECHLMDLTDQLAGYWELIGFTSYQEAHDSFEVVQMALEGVYGGL